MGGEIKATKDFLNDLDRVLKHLVENKVQEVYFENLYNEMGRIHGISKPKLSEALNY